MKQRRHVLVGTIILVCGGALGAAVASDAPKPTPYRAEGNAIVKHNRGNGGSYHNRPLFINNTHAFALAGEQPIVRFGRDQQVYGALHADDCLRSRLAGQMAAPV